ncbi:MAG: transposase, partial [bacterium]|nr:transposase [bacterium]
GTKNYECNIHLGRYLEELIQNIPDILWTKNMKQLFFRMNNTKKIAINFGLSKFNNSKIKEYEKEFDDILNVAKQENKNIKSTFYKDKANQLYRRLKKYKKNHLYFIKDFSVPFDNNVSERDLRIFKTKTKISGGFRSVVSAMHYVNALSIIKTSIQRNINPFESIKLIFNNQKLFS